MELSDDHKAELQKFINFFNRKRDEVVVEMELITDEFRDDNVEDGELYNGDDVAKLFDNLKKSVKAHAHGEITNILRLAGVYVKYCLSFAQDSGTSVEINMNLIEDSKMKEEIGDIEKGTFHKQNTIGAIKLPSVAIGNELQEKIDKLEAKLKKSQDRIYNLESELLDSRRDAQSNNAGLDSNSVGNTRELENRISELEAILEDKITNTPQVQNLKKMLQAKNDAVKEYKARLSKYEKLDD